ncbi:MAG: EamA family transporter [Candidatus Pacearchaeota archaeon]
MDSWLIFALLSAVFAALVSIFAKVGLQGVDANTATTVRAFIMFLFLIGVILIQGKFDNIFVFFLDKKILLFIILSGIAGALSWLFYFIAIKKGTVTKVVSIDRLSIVFAMVFAFVFLNEKVTIKSILGVLLIAVGAIIIAIDN